MQTLGDKMKPMSDVWNDIGYTEKENKPAESMKRRPSPLHEALERTEQRRIGNKALIETLKPYCESFIDHGSNIITKLRIPLPNGEVSLRVIEWWPATGTYHSRSKGLYAWGIQQQVEAILTFIKQVEEERS